MWSDKETPHDFLGFSTYVEVLADICTQSNLAPLTLGIFGPWGSGKTSLMQMVENRLLPIRPILPRILAAVSEREATSNSMAASLSICSAAASGFTTTLGQH
jgi:pantothenate kinase-related protein Tda10